MSASKSGDNNMAIDGTMSEATRKSILWHIEELRKLGAIVNARSVGGDAGMVVTVKSRVADAKAARANPVSRNELCQMVTEGEKTIMDRLISGGYVAWSATARRGGGYELTKKGFTIASNNGSMLVFDAKKTIKALGLTDNGEYF